MSVAIIHNQYSLLIIGQPIPAHLSASLEYITLKEMLADLVDLLAVHCSYLQVYDAGFYAAKIVMTWNRGI